MNFLQNRKEVDFFKDINPISFRTYQYENIKHYLENAINFVSQQNNNYLEVVDIKITKRSNYTGIYNSKYSNVTIITKNKIKNEVKKFTSFFIPTLLDRNHFILNGRYYTPGLYLIDYPITVKKKSIMISSLFNSITIYNKDDIVIFTGRNFKLESFIQLFVDFDNKLYQNYILRNKLNHNEWSKENLVEFYSNKFSTIKDIDKIRDKIENIFFDNYTRELYKKCYNLQNVSLKDIILLGFKKSVEGEKSFNDLSNKRLVFIEYLLKPFLTRLSGLATEVAKGIPKDHIQIDELTVIKYFLTSVDLNNPTGKKTMGLSGNYIFDAKNLYNCLLQPKATFLTPGMNVPPSEVKHLHQSHFGRICPITISSQQPGEVISISTDVKLNEFGCFE